MHATSGRFRGNVPAGIGDGIAVRTDTVGPGRRFRGNVGGTEHGSCLLDGDLITEGQQSLRAGLPLLVPLALGSLLEARLDGREVGPLKAIRRARPDGVEVHVGHAGEQAFGVEQRLALEAAFPEAAPATIFTVGAARDPLG